MPRTSLPTRFPIKDSGLAHLSCSIYVASTSSQMALVTGLNEMYRAGADIKAILALRGKVRRAGERDEFLR